MTRSRTGRSLAALTAGFAALAVFISAAEAQTPKRKRGDAPQQEQKADAPKNESYETNFPTKATWNLSQVNAKAPPGEATLTIDDNLRGSGVSGCNSWSAALYPVRGHKLAMGPVAQTKKTCANDVMQFEKLYLTILHSGPEWNLVGSTLTIKSQVGTLVFNRGL